MASRYQFVSGDTGSKLQVTCKNDADNSIINLTGATVKLKWKDSAGLLISKTMTITNAVGGIAEYQFGTSELYAGAMSFEIEITDTSSKIITSLSLVDTTIRNRLS